MAVSGTRGTPTIGPSVRTKHGNQPSLKSRYLGELCVLLAGTSFHLNLLSGTFFRLQKVLDASKMASLSTFYTCSSDAFWSIPKWRRLFHSEHFFPVTTL
uniref:(northern house mosquito) hypothetical protein n=1 Tax=Culex pipiens TaxID=7175 RepID=A0A8D7ZV59_CULPI